MKALLLIFISVVIITPILWADELVIAADPWCPYVCEPGSAKPGFMVEIAKTVFAKAGHSVLYKTEPWARAIKNSRDGKNNGAFGAFISDAPDHIFSDEALGTSTTAVFVKKGSTWKYTGAASLENVSLGVIRGYSYGEEIDNYVKKHEGNSKRVQLSNTLDSLVQKLVRGRIGAFPDDRMVVGWYLKQNNLNGKLQEAGVAIEAEGVHIAFSPKLASSKKYIKILSTGVKTIRKSGELSKILARYGLKDWK